MTGAKDIRTAKPVALLQVVERLGTSAAADRLGMSLSTIYNARDKNSVRFTAEIAAKWVLHTLNGGPNTDPANPPKDERKTYTLLVSDDKVQFLIQFIGAMRGISVQRFLLDFESQEVKAELVVLKVPKEKQEPLDAFISALKIECGTMVE